MMIEEEDAPVLAVRPGQITKESHELASRKNGEYIPLSVDRLP